MNLTTPAFTSTDSNNEIPLSTEEVLEQAHVMSSIAAFPKQNKIPQITNALKKQFLSFFNASLNKGILLIDSLQLIPHYIIDLENKINNITYDKGEEKNQRAVIESENALKTIQSRMDELQQKMQNNSDLLAQLRRERDTYQHTISTVMRNDQMLTVGTISSDEKLCVQNYHFGAYRSPNGFSLGLRLKKIPHTASDIDGNEKSPLWNLQKTIAMYQTSDLLVAYWTDFDNGELRSKSLPIAKVSEILPLLSEHFPMQDDRLSGFYPHLSHGLIEKIKSLYDIPNARPTCYGSKFEALYYPPAHSGDQRKHSIAYKGDPFYTYTVVPDDFVVDCQFSKRLFLTSADEPTGLFLGRLKKSAEFDVNFINASAGIFNATYTPPEECYGKFRINFEAPAYATRQSQAEIQDATELLNAVENRIALAYQYEKALTMAQHQLQEQRLQIHSLKMQYNNNYSDFNMTLLRNLADYNQLIAEKNKILFSTHKIFHSLETSIAQLKNNTNLTTVHSFIFDRKNMIGIEKEISSIGLSYNHYEHFLYYQGKPYTTVDYSCLEKTHGYQYILPEIVSNESRVPQNGLYTGKFVSKHHIERHVSSENGRRRVMSPIDVNSACRIDLKRPYNEREHVKLEIRFLENHFAETKFNLSHYSRYVDELKNRREKIQGHLLKLLTQKKQDESLALKNKAIKIDGNREKIIALTKNYEDSLAHFFADQPLYDTLSAFIQIGNLTDSVSTQFQKAYFAVAAMITNNASYEPTYSGSWKIEAHGKDIRTGAPIFRASLFVPPSSILTNTKMDLASYRAVEIGSIDLFATKALCRSADYGTTNVLAASGIFKEESFDPKTLLTVCRQLPVTYLDIAKNGAMQGALRGTANVMGRTIASGNFSKFSEKFLQESLYYIGYFLMQFYHHSKQHDMVTALGKSAIDIFCMLLVGVVLKVIGEIITRVTPPTILRHASLFFCKTLLPTAYSAYQAEAINFEDAKMFLGDAGTFTGASIAATAAVEIIAKAFSPGNTG